MYTWCVLEKTLESPLDCNEIQPHNPKGKQPWIFIGRTDAKVEAPILWPPDAKSWLKTQDSKNLSFLVMASSPITSWQIDGRKVGTVTDFIFLGSKITAYSDCTHEIKRCLLLGRKAMKNLDSILNSRDITLPTKFCKVKAMVFPVVMYGCESWTIKKAERQRIDALELWW